MCACARARVCVYACMYFQTRMSQHHTRICLWPTKGRFPSKSGRVWAGLDIPIGLRVALCIHVGSQVLAVCFILGPSSVPFSMAQPDEKTTAVGASRMISTLVEICCFVLCDSITSTLIRSHREDPDCDGTPHCGSR